MGLIDAPIHAGGGLMPLVVSPAPAGLAGSSSCGDGGISKTWLHLQRTRLPANFADQRY